MKEKMNIMLDLDQTIISAEPSEEFNFKKNKEKMKKFKYHDMDGYYMVFERPNLQPFLDFLFANFNVSVWTAASKDYALFIIDKIIITKPDRKLDWIFFSYHCTLSKEYTKNSKNLTMLWDIYDISYLNAENTVIIDDNDEVYNTQQGNCIVAKPFEFSNKDSHKDNFLQKLQDSLKKIKPSKNPAKKINKILSN